LSFDISVLEILWTLSRGLRVVMFAGDSVNETTLEDVELDFGLFYFAAGGESGAGEDKYRLLLEGARFADANGFDSVWTPERHFHDFGGLYPNPVVAAAALATITENIDIRAGSVVLPLHSPIRVAEDWALVDNLSNGRVGMSIASGWHPNDFALAPANYADRKQVMVEALDTVRRLWRGEEIEVTNGVGEKTTVGTLPRPIQEYLPVWVTTAGNIETYREAGRQGANVLTHLLGQSVAEVAEKVAAYRAAYRDSGAPGRGQVSLMLHTFVGEDTDQIRELVRQPMKDYLRSSASLVKDFVSSWTAYRGNSGRAVEASGDEFHKLSPEDMEDLLDFAFERYFETSGLFGSQERCLEMLRAVYAADVDEIACLIDFGVQDDLVLAQLKDLNELRQVCRAKVTTADDRPTIAELIAEHHVTHMQCTPSMARMMLGDPAAKASLGQIDMLLIGGEAFPRDLAEELQSTAPKLHVLNMYGPTETTVWSASRDLSGGPLPEESSVPIGRPIANTELVVLDEAGKFLPHGVAGELRGRFWPC
jgi:natural product biosynthesis luciferase-like monooxygenase protein